MPSSIYIGENSRFWIHGIIVVSTYKCKILKQSKIYVTAQLSSYTNQSVQIYKNNEIWFFQWYWIFIEIPTWPPCWLTAWPCCWWSSTPSSSALQWAVHDLHPALPGDACCVPSPQGQAWCSKQDGMGGCGGRVSYPGGWTVSGALGYKYIV